MSELTVQLQAALIELRVNRMLPDDYDGATENAIGHIERALELAKARSSHSDVSADLRARIVALRDGARRNGETGWAAQMDNLLALAAPLARAEAAPEREGLDVGRLKEAWRLAERKTGHRGFALTPYDVAAEYARLAPTSPSSEETA